MMWVRFTDDGIPAWFGPEPVLGAELVEDVGTDVLLTCRRTAKGKWQRRPAVQPVAPTPEDVALAQEAAYQVAVEARRNAVRDALAREADPLFFQWQRGEATEADWLARVAEVKARLPRPEPL
jgi:hypothetical protein